jgi:hypothetical protein
MAPKLLEVGWDAPTPAYAARHLRKMERRPFDGVVMDLAAIRRDGSRFLTKRVTPARAFVGDRAALSSMKSGKLTDNFVRLNSACDDGWDWFSHRDWVAARTNVQRIAVTAASGPQVAGIFFDPEPYGRNCWNYAEQIRKGNKSFRDYEAVVRTRGASFMRQLQRADPQLKVLGTALMSGVKDGPWLDPNSSPRDLRSALKRHGEGLLPAFVDGMVSVAKPGTIVADGNENSYYALNMAGYWAGERRVINRGARKVVRGYDRARYREFYRHDYAVYADLNLDLFEPGPDCADWCGQWVPHYLGQRDRLRLLKRQIYDALKTSDEYVWYYSERQDWWNFGGRDTGQQLAPVSADAKAAVARARKRFRAGRPLRFDLTPAFEEARRECVAAGGRHCR